jgi:hypothetical protein
MAELEKVKRDKSFYKAFESLESTTKTTLEMAYKALNAIDGESGGDKEDQ